MRNLFGPDTITGYCTNVHAGPTFDQMLENLRTHAIPVKRMVSPDEPMGVGLWLTDDAAKQIIEQGRAHELCDWLRIHGLIAYTFNGFPFGDFHQPVVKHLVYQPQWNDDARLNYTINLATILAQLLPEGVNEGGISTLPIGWRKSVESDSNASFNAAMNLCKLADALTELEEKTGKLIHVDIEPEPGCYLDTAEDVVEFFKEELLLVATSEYRVRRYLRICHDICHSAVMFEPQCVALKRYADAGISVGKVQVSSAVRTPFDRLDDYERIDALKQLQGFAEDRYLHQTVANVSGSTFYSDLPDALAEFSETPPPQVEWRTHFHVPLYLERFGLLETTQADVIECLTHVRELTDCKHFEAETYAWSVLPKALQEVSLAHGIAKELQWLKDQAAVLNG